jgi:hypothetical protein
VLQMEIPAAGSLTRCRENLQKLPIHKGFVLTRHVARFDQWLDGHTQVRRIGEQSFDPRRKPTA